MIEEGQTLPDVTLMKATADGPEKTSTHEVFGEGRSVLFAVPGAFTPTCSARHLPGFVEKADALRQKGADRIACVSVNDAFVMQAWGEEAGAGDADILLLADGNGEFARALGLTMDGSGFGMGERSQRYAMVIEDGKVTALDVEEPGAFEVSSADHVMTRL